MANYYEINLGCMTIPRECLDEVSTCLVETIVFHRALGDMAFKEISTPELDLIYVSCDQPEVEEKVLTELTNFLLEIKQSDNFTMELTFFAERLRRGWFWDDQENVEWEKWRISFSVSTEPVDSLVKEKVREDVSLQSLNIIKEVTKRADIPVTLKDQKEPLSFQFSLQTQKTSSGGSLLSVLF